MAVVRFLFAGVAALSVAGGGIGLATTVTLASTTTSDRMPTCITSGPVDGLAAAQSANARIITGVATGRAGHIGALITVMTALAESDLLILANPSDPAGNTLPHDGVGHDHDSLGLFQQRPSWGTAAQRMDPAESTNLFLDALLALPGWERRPPWEAAQAVQRSAFTGIPNTANGGSNVLGGNYLARMPQAQAVLAVIDADASTLDCGGIGPGLPPGDAARFGLPDTYQIPTGTSTAASAAVIYALAQLGKPYVWGGNGPNGFDCSGLMQQAWLRAGIRIGRTTYDQMLDGTPTTPVGLQPGDLILVPGANGSLASPGHVGMYLGFGLVVHAPQTGDVVRVTAYEAFARASVSAHRHMG